MNELIRDFEEYSTNFTKTACEHYANYLKEYQKEKIELEQKLDKILAYAKSRCDGYLEDLKKGHLDCEYCDGVFASCRKILQLAGKDIKKYK